MKISQPFVDLFAEN